MLGDRLARGLERVFATHAYDSFVVPVKRQI